MNASSIITKIKNLLNINKCEEELKKLNRKNLELKIELSLLARDYQKLEEEYKRYKEQKEQKADRKKQIFLTNLQVRNIEQRLLILQEKNGFVTHKQIIEIAKEFGVSFRTIQRIAYGEHKYSSKNFKLKVVKYAKDN